MILVTGASGFIGNALSQVCVSKGQSVVAVFRQAPPEWPSNHEYLRCHAVGDIDGQTEWESVLCGIDVVVHCAARVHVSREREVNPLVAYRLVNVEGTLRLAREAAAAGVRRFVFVSSIGVCGNESFSPFDESSPTYPHDEYSRSKLEAESALLGLARLSSMEVVIIRPPLVYGVGAPGSFSSLVSWINRGVPLPLGAVNNKRSLLALDNLVSFLLLCASREDSPMAANQIFVISDGEDVSTSDLLRKVAKAAGRPCRLVSMPLWVLRAGASLLGKRALADRLLCDLQIDSTKARTMLGWRPVVTMDAQLAAMFRSCVDTASSHAKHWEHPRASLTGESRRSSSPLLRGCDISLAALGLLVLWPLLLLICLIGLFDTGSPLFTQRRVGRYKRPFILIKFRTMRVGTPSVASHLASSSSITPLGQLLRRTKLDELPQLWNVLRGQMSLVGPRPGLMTQHDLIEARDAYGVYSARPGITGLAQVTGIDMSNPELLAETDARMLKDLNLKNYLKLIFLTIVGKGAGDRIRKQ
jgi:lipopolysaccharide/colanic/teichoic acid biosynthesis glycosyltransferase/NAD dependent epimerase/dehydratase family enzyme